MTRTLRTPPHEHLRQRLTEERKDAGLTQAELGELLQRPQSYVSKYETGEHRLDVIELVEIANALELNAADLVDEIQRLVLKARKSGR